MQLAVFEVWPFRGLMQWQHVESASLHALLIKQLRGLSWSGEARSLVLEGSYVNRVLRSSYKSKVKMFPPVSTACACLGDVWTHWRGFLNYVLTWTLSHGKKILLKMYLYLFVCVREDSMRIMSLPLRYESRNKTQVVSLGSKWLYRLSLPTKGFFSQYLRM